jgi:hypothetical protein
MPTPPSAPREYRGSSGPRLCKGKRFNSEIISSMIESLTAAVRGDKPPPAVAAFWIKEEDYPALLQLFDDGDKMPPRWKDWLKMAEEMERGLKAYGHVVLRVYIDPTTFPDWCAAHATSPGSAGRRKFVAAAVTERYGRQT